MKDASPFKAILITIILLFGAGHAPLAAAASKVEVERALSDPALEARAQALAREIRCVVCENEPVALSSAEIAVDMRKAIRARVAAGDSDAQVRRFFAERYGEFVLLRPRVGPETWVLWGAPFLLISAGGLALWLISRRQRPQESQINQDDDDQVRAALDRLQAP
jgi:cytochrome c-type biogenesis protein CcmH